MQRRPEDEVVDAGELLVDPFDEVVLDGGRPTAPGGGIATKELLCRSFAEQGHPGPSAGVGTISEPLPGTGAHGRHLRFKDAELPAPVRFRPRGRRRRPRRVIGRSAASSSLRNLRAFGQSGLGPAGRPHPLQQRRRGRRRPGTSLAMNSALSADSNSQSPARIGTRKCAVFCRKRSNAATSKIGRVTANSAPASTLYSNRRSSRSRSRAAGFTITPDSRAVGAPIG